MFLNDDETEYQKTKTSENFNSKLSQKQRHFSNDFSDQEEINDFFRFTDMININTLGSQPIIMYRKEKRLYSPKEEKRINKKPLAKSQEKILVNNYIKPNYICDGGLPQKLNKFKSKTNRNNENNKKRPKTQKVPGKNKEFIPKTIKTNIRQKNNIIIIPKYAI